MYDVVCFGEAMVRLMPPGFRRLEQTEELDVKVGGGELNVAVGVSRLGLKAAWVSRLPENPLGRMIRNKAREQGVSTEHLVWSKEGRAGLYFLEQGSAPRASAVLYDRAHSAISLMQPGEADWDACLKGAKWFHVSGITPALSASCAAVTLEALRKAKEHNCTVSYDLNYRGKLWTPEQAEQCQTPMMDLVDVLITTEDDADTVFHQQGEPGDIAKRLQQRFGFQAVAITLREIRTVWTGGWTSIVYADKLYTDRTYTLENVDRVGGGDSFSAGLIYGRLTQNSWEAGLKWGNAFSAIKHSIPGDLNWATREETEKLMQQEKFKIQR